ncbi:MAG: molybdenum cofactor guanylyltransferase, partial [Cytophagales bacterium]|nr:molybdenum cofactor guanylyltransferase [Cytophagales bacterium]
MSCNVFYPGEESMLLGVALCGGHSTRMGADKGLLVRGGTSWAQLAVEKLSQFQIPVVLSIREEQLPSYSNYFDSHEFVLDLGEIHGPLAGIMSVHSRFTENDLLVLACDLPDISMEVLEKLTEVYQEKAGEHDFLVFHHDNDLEPLVGIYTAEGLSKIASLLSSGQLEKHSMKHLLEIGNT